MSTNDIVEQHATKMAEGLREAMSRLPGGIVVVTTWISGRPWGLTVSSCCSLSMQPPLLLICLKNGTSPTKAILEQGCFGVSVLATDQVEVARRVAQPRALKFIDDLVLPEAEMGTPALKGSLASIHCELYNALVVGDHTIMIGEVGEVVLGTLREPLVYFHREFHAAVEKAEVRQLPRESAPESE
jgi:flavin reductase ActVB